ncbi:hypothetical protein CH300_17795 [Rhodococcus sp. 15-1154-1]|nr:hypothetical protein CH300_17795 [Rhodococcus sp. 15-1154-1]
MNVISSNLLHFCVVYCDHYLDRVANLAGWRDDIEIYPHLVSIVFYMYYIESFKRYPSSVFQGFHALYAVGNLDCFSLCHDLLLINLAGH